jgi:thiol-disulfide isomerase/thioredoxin
MKSTANALSVFLVAAALCSRAEAQELTIGADAPSLAITHWMKGAEVTTFAPGQVYVLEFWATWCAPCVANMEHLSLVQERYRDRGVHVIGLSDEPLQTTVKFLVRRYGPEQKSQNDRTRYALATDPDRSVHEGYFEAAGLRGIPAVFVIGKTAKVEWIGHPKDLDPVIEAVVADKWDRAAHRDKVMAEREATKEDREARERFQEAVREERWDDALLALHVLERSPEDGDLSKPTIAGILLSRKKDYEAGNAYMRRVTQEHWNDNSWLLYQMAWLLSGNDQFPLDAEHRDLDAALRYGERAVELDPFDYYYTMLAKIHDQRGEVEEAMAAQERAIAALESKRPKILDHEMERFEEQLKGLRQTARGVRGEGKVDGWE